MSTILHARRPHKPANHCVKCRIDHQPAQHRVIYTSRVSLFANALPVFNAPYGTEEIKLEDAWFYASLHVPLNNVLSTLEKGHLPWLCPQCAGYESEVNRVAPGATILNDEGHQIPVPLSARYEEQRAERQSAKVTSLNQFRANAG